MILTVSLSILFGLLLLGVVLVILLDDGDSGRKVAWLLVITVLPFVGLILYILIESTGGRIISSISGTAAPTPLSSPRRPRSSKPSSIPIPT